MSIDDETLTHLVTAALDDVEVPVDGPARILAAREGLPAGALTDPAARGLWETETETDGDDAASDHGGEVGGLDGGPPAPLIRRRQRLALGGAAAAVALLLAVVVGVVASGGSSSKTSSSSSAAPVLRAPTAPSGTSASSAASGTQDERSPLSAGSASGAGTPAAVGTPAGGGAQSGVSSTQPSDVPAAPSGTRVVQTGSLTLTVAEGRVDATVGSLGDVAAGLGGSVTRSQTSPDASGATADLTLQVPAAAFAPLIKQVEALGTPSSVTTSSADVTSQYVDLTARIAALEATRQQFLDILAKAESISDILSVENEITPLQTQIEQLQGQQQVLDQQTSTASLSVHVQEQAPAATPPPAAPGGLSKAWHKATHSFTTGIESVVGDLGGIAVFLLCVAVIVVLGRLAWLVGRRRLV